MINGNIRGYETTSLFVMALLNGNFKMACQKDTVQKELFLQIYVELLASLQKFG